MKIKEDVVPTPTVSISNGAFDNTIVTKKKSFKSWRRDKDEEEDKNVIPEE